MVKVQATADFDYINKKVYYTVQGTGSRDWNSCIVSLISPKGYIASQGTVSRGFNYGSFSMGMASGEMYMQYGNYGFHDQHTTNVKSSLFFSDFYSHWVLSRAVDTSVQAVFTGVETGLIPPTITISQIDNVYEGVPVLIERGDAVGHFRIDTVSGQNTVTVSTDAGATVYLSTSNLANSIGEVLSGARSGQRFYVHSFNGSTSQLTVDRNLTSYSGDLIKVMPYRHVVGYSGWENYTGFNPHPSFNNSNYSNTFGGILSKFTLDAERPISIGSAMTGRTMTAIDGEVTYDMQSLFNVGGSGIVTFPSKASFLDKDLTYNRDVQFGDIVVFNPENDPSHVSGAVILSVDDYSATQWRVYIHPPCAVNSLSNEVYLYRQNVYKLLTAPAFDTNYILNAGLNGVNYGTEVVRTPSANLDVSVNEFDSTYNTVGEQVHFHIGPVTLSNGQVLTNDYTLRLSGALYQGDVTSSSPITSWYRHGTMDTSIGTIANGQYAKLGVLTATYNAALNASETLYLRITSEYGTAKINKVITIPVQPSV